ncbi:MAG: ABC transporter ATP-binding protein [Proteobacteria bacterium]|nr:ABC transporter ATP-binding protein [Pseudomonadota bacterium]
MLQVEGLAKRYRDQVALADVDFDVREGEILGVIGPNGSGKTTLLECLTGLQPADSGKVRWWGEPLMRDQRKRAMFYVPDGIAPYAEHPVHAVLSFVASVYRQPLRAKHDAIEALELGPVLQKNVGTLSKGFRRRLLLALGLIAPHGLLVMDEPFDGFDLRQTRDVMTLLRATARNGRTMLLSIHQLSDAERMCDRFVLLSLGSVRGRGSLEELRRQSGLAAGKLEEIFLALG